MIGSHLITRPGDGCNLERRNNAVCFFINLRVLKVILEPLALHLIIRLLVWRYIRFNDEVVALQIKIQDFHGILLPFQVQPIQLYIADGRLKAGVIGHIIKLPDGLQSCGGLRVGHKLLLQQQIKDIQLIQERYAWFLDRVFANAVFEKKKGQRKESLAQLIYSSGYEAFVSGVSLGKDPEVDAPLVRAQYRIRGEIENAEVVEKMYFDRLLDFVYVELMKGLQKGFVPKRCANCGRWFLQMPGMTYAYCGEPAPGQDGKTCREIGATSSFRSKVQNNDVWKAHQRAYKKYFARTRKGTMSKGVFEVWSRKMETLRDDALMEYDRAKSEEERQRIVDEVTQKLNKL